MQTLFINLIIWCTFSSLKPTWFWFFDALYIRLFFWRFGISFSTFLIFNLSDKNGRLLCFLGSSFGHSISNFKIYPCPSFFTSLFIFIRFIRSLSIFNGSLTLNMENMSSFHQDCIALSNNYYWFLHRI